MRVSYIAINPTFEAAQTTEEMTSSLRSPKPPHTGLTMSGCGRPRGGSKQAAGRRPGASATFRVLAGAPVPFVWRRQF